MMINEVLDGANVRNSIIKPAKSALQEEKIFPSTLFGALACYKLVGLEGHISITMEILGSRWTTIFQLWSSGVLIAIFLPIRIVSWCYFATVIVETELEGSLDRSGLC